MEIILTSSKEMCYDEYDATCNKQRELMVITGLLVSMFIVVILFIIWEDSNKDYNKKHDILKLKVLAKIESGDLSGIDAILGNTHNENLKRYLLDI